MLSGSGQNKAFIDANAFGTCLLHALLGATSALPSNQYRSDASRPLRTVRLGVSGVTDLEHKSKRSHLSS